ncbi:exodeoxyribonuclease VII large subunit [Aliidiomarina maris]|uniref:Exodeoxyribonuclease 7 large subunit n=1 Tax=Aliidiomarina maris TaxID=531312 RepID=A0A327X4Q4_9GAMM|nr:exodeoxyribonuclease VII large subunit [Aliidiomarina maris]RAK00689.1 exodeoxyribonuclease VII large subunit [Aliidiomarina maris]
MNHTPSDDFFAHSGRANTPQRTIFSVSKLNTSVRRLLESHFGDVWIVGEISNFSAPSSGHWYFTLKDDKAQVRCAMFRGANQRVMTQVGNGKQVLVRAKIGLYEPRGDYQLIAEHMEDAGVGLLQQQFEQLKARLQAEGLFDPQHKKPLPQPVRRIGVVTSATGAALHDVLAVLKRRDPSVEVVVYPAQVQGEQAPAQLISALNIANQRQEVDVILLTRGGGSLEDLWCFNDETLARVVFTSRLPIVSAVGHEVDFSICDFVADVRAATPSAAAELLSQDRSHLKAQQQLMAQRLWRAWQHQLRGANHRFALMQQRLQPLHPQQQLQQQGQQLDDLQRRMQQGISRMLQQLQQRAHTGQERTRAIQPQRIVQQANQQLAQQTQRANRALQLQLKQAQQRFGSQVQLLQMVSPLNTLSRGYSISQDAQGQVIKNVSQLKVGDVLHTRIAEGTIKSQVTALKSHTESHSTGNKSADNK